MRTLAENTGHRPTLLSATGSSPHAWLLGPDVGEVVGGRYRTRSQLGVGGMGEVWLADDLVLGRSVAIKRLHLSTDDAPGIPSIREEARSLARVAHPGVVVVHDLVEPDPADGAFAWLVMESLTGRSLLEVLRDRGRLSVDEVVHLAVQLLAALGAIHEAGLVHRDVKPANIHVCDGRRVVLIDFGLCVRTDDCAGSTVGLVAGSLPYLAPESWGDGRFGTASDLFALGVTLFRAVEGRLPFDAESPSRARATGGPLARPMRHAGRIGPVVSALLDPDPDRRIDATEARDRLAAMSPSPVTTDDLYWKASA